MRYNQHLSYNLSSTPLVYGQIELKPAHRFTCCFLVDHIINEEYIRSQARQLFLAGCREFVFVGREAERWHIGFDEVDIALNLNGTSEPVAVTTSYADKRSFADMLRNRLSEETLVPHDYILVYDDPVLYQKILNLLGFSLQKIISAAF